MCLLTALFMIRDHNFLKTVTGSKDHEAYVDELTVIAPQKLEMLKKRIGHKFQVFCHISSVKLAP